MSAAAIAQIEPMTSARALRGPFDYRLPEELRPGVGVGSMLLVPFGRRQVLGVVVGLADSSDVEEAKLLAPLRALDEIPPTVPAELVALAQWVAAEYCSTIARALTLVLPPGAAKRLSGRRRRKVTRAVHEPVGARMPTPPALNEDQLAALGELRAALVTGDGQRRLLHGVTGSGKTEIYLRLAADALAQDRGAIVLVPEIALTPQIVARFTERFGDTVAVLHSRLTPGQRYEEWRRLREGEARVCVGPRSAVFAPVQRLGLLVVDEEHDGSYKHEGDPRYDARDVAAWRAERCGALLVAGSATPRAESAARLTACRLPRRVDGRALPEVEVLDMRDTRSALHRATLQALADVRSRGEKAIMLLNRRGWSNFLSCRTCGRVWSCPECDVSLVLHRAGGYVACHHCGHRERVPARCPDCASASVARHGAGTERLAHELAAILDGDGRFPVFRLDADTPGDPATLLRAFESAPAGLLLGTQMVAKGHDFTDVALGVVLDADATLRFPDFRAEERTFALISQLAGRAGRAGRGGRGRVLVQTIAPEARAIAHAARHDCDGFLEGELERRRLLAYPPYSHLIRVVCAAERSADARGAALAIRESLLARLRDNGSGNGEGAGNGCGEGIGSGHGEGIRNGIGHGSGEAGRERANVLGPADLFRLRGRERQVLLVKTPERRAAVAAVGAAVEQTARERAHAAVSFSVDVDPQ